MLELVGFLICLVFGLIVLIVLGWILWKVWVYTFGGGSKLYKDKNDKYGSE